MLAFGFFLVVEPEACYSPWPIANPADCVGRLNPPSEIKRLRGDGAGDADPIIAKLNKIADADEEFARIEIARYLMGDSGEEVKLNCEGYTWFEMRCKSAPDSDGYLTAKQTLFNGLFPMIVSGGIKSVRSLQDGFLFCIRSNATSKIGAFNYKFGYAFSLIAKDDQFKPKDKEN